MVSRRAYRAAIGFFCVASALFVVSRLFGGSAVDASIAPEAKAKHTGSSVTLAPTNPTVFGPDVALLLLCCDVLASSPRQWGALEALLVPPSQDTGGDCFVLDGGGHDETSAAACDKWCTLRGRRVTRVQGTLVTLWKRFEKTRRLLVVDSDIQAPLSTFAAHSALPVEDLMLAFHSVATMPRGKTVEADARRVEALKVCRIVVGVCVHRYYYSY